jgi:hypothetical protein
MPMQPIHRLVDLGQRADGGVEWACPQCGRYLVRYPDSQLVVGGGRRARPRPHPRPRISRRPGRGPDGERVR